MKLNARARSIPDYVDTLDGFRAIATLLVLIFHYWQQSWVSMVVHIGPVSTSRPSSPSAASAWSCCSR